MQNLTGSLGESCHVLLSLPISAAQQTRITAAAPQFCYRFCTEETATLDDVQWADAILGNVPVDLIRANQHLRWFQSNWAGPDAFLAPGVLPKDCIITNVSGAYGLAIGEWMMAMWLSLLKDLPLYRDRQNRCLWDRIERPVKSVWGATVVCVGFGDIGQNFGQHAAAMGAHVIGVRRNGTDGPDWCQQVILQKDLDRVLPQADCVALALPNTPETCGLFGAERLAKMKTGSILINVGRGSAVDSDALCEAIRHGPLYGAALDVTEPEPLPPEHPLWREPTVILTPHTAGRFSLPQTLENIVDIFAHNLSRFAAGLPLDNQVNRVTHYVSGGAGGQRLVSAEKLTAACQGDSL